MIERGDIPQHSWGRWRNTTQGKRRNEWTILAEEIGNALVEDPTKGVYFKAPKNRINQIRSTVYGIIGRGKHNPGLSVIHDEGKSSDSWVAFLRQIKGGEND